MINEKDIKQIIKENSSLVVIGSGLNDDHINNLKYKLNKLQNNQLYYNIIHMIGSHTDKKSNKKSFSIFYW